MTINLFRTCSARVALLALLLATLGGGLFVYARAPYVIDLRASPDLSIDAEPGRYRCLVLDCSQAIPSELEVLGNPAAWSYPDCHQAQARTPWDLIFHEAVCTSALAMTAMTGPRPMPARCRSWDMTPHRGVSPRKRYCPRSRWIAFTVRRVNSGRPGPIPGKAGAGAMSIGVRRAVPGVNSAPCPARFIPTRWPGIAATCSPA